jgi:hypothetical protein
MNRFFLLTLVPNNTLQMTHTRLIFIFLMLWALQVSAANDNYPFGARQSGMANTGVTLHDFWAISHNQAGLAQMEHMAGGFYFENRFQAREMSMGAAAVVMPVNAGVFGLSMTYYGFSLYNEGKVGLAYARQLSDKLSVGLQFNYLFLSIGEGYGSRSNYSIEMGVIYELLPALHIGTHIYNLSRSRIASVDDLYDEYVPTIIRFGLSYAFSEQVMLLVETEKDIERDPEFRAGLEYRLSEHIYARGGIGTSRQSNGTNAMVNAFGFGLETGALRIDLSASYHYVLGYSPQAGLTYTFK